MTSSLSSLSLLSVVAVLGLFLLAMISGMVGLGVAFAAVPFLSLFMTDLATQIQPLTLLLNGITASFAAYGFARAGFVQWRTAGICAGVGVLVAVSSSRLALLLPERVVWILYFACVIVLLYVLFAPPIAGSKRVNLWAVIGVTVFVTLLATLLGIGPGFLLVPALIAMGMPAKNAAAFNVVVAAPSSFAALIPRLPSAEFAPLLTVLLVIAGAGGALLGSHLSSHYVSERTLKRLFAAVVIVLSAYKAYTLL